MVAIPSVHGLSSLESAVAAKARPSEMRSLHEWPASAIREALPVQRPATSFKRDKTTFTTADKMLIPLGVAKAAGDATLDATLDGCVGGAVARTGSVVVGDVVQGS